MNDPEQTGDYQPGGNDKPAVDAAPAAQPQHVGRYRIEKILGKGSFGVVYLAHDDQLRRLVAIKVPHAKLIARPEDAEAYLTEARTVANLDHPHIVPVYDVGSNDQFPCFVVSKYIEGSTLAQRIRKSRPTFGEAAALVATIAEALQYAHRHGLVRRDVKPGNILLDTSGKPFVVDFGLALREQEIGHGPKYAGTPAYMSPEQARGDGHRVDGRSDIFSLGVVLYELLVGRQPFRADSQADLLEQVTSFEPRPPRQYDENIPKELERICLKALAKRAAAWNSKPENRHLPAWWEWANLRLYTRQRDWTPPQRRMMRRAGLYHAVRGGLLVLALVVLTFAGWWTFGALEARARVENLLTAKTADVPDIAQGLAPYRGWATPLLREAFAEAERDGNKRRQLHASLALLPVDPGQVKYLQGRLLHGDPEEVLVIRQALLEHQQNLTDLLWELLENAAKDPDQRFRAACALAAFAPDDPRWDKARDEVAGKLAAQKPFEIARWTELLKPVRKALLPPLAAFLEDEKRTPAERALIASIYGSYAADVPGAYARLETRLADASAPDALAEKKLELTKKQANIGASLLVMDRGDKVWPLLKHSRDPTLRSHLIERIGPGGVDARLLLARLAEEKDTSIRRALLLSLGAYRLDRLPLPQSEQHNLVFRMLDLYRNDPDPGVHGAARWLLKQWRAEEKIKEIDEASRVASAPGVKRGWYVNGQGQTMVVIPKPREGLFWMGEGQERHQQPLGHDFALSSEDVTVEQFLQFCKENRKEYKYQKMTAPTQDSPAIEVSWYEAAAYCNWLSQREGIAEAQWCYEPNKEGKYAEGMKIKAGYLGLKGYRLPTEAEWEYACRASSTVTYSFGEPVELLQKYGWYVVNSVNKAHPSETRTPSHAPAWVA